MTSFGAVTLLLGTSGVEKRWTYHQAIAQSSFKPRYFSDNLKISRRERFQI